MQTTANPLAPGLAPSTFYLALEFLMICAAFLSWEAGRRWESGILHGAGWFFLGLAVIAYEPI